MYTVYIYILICVYTYINMYKYVCIYMYIMFHISLPPLHSPWIRLRPVVPSRPQVPGALCSWESSTCHDAGEVDGGVDGKGMPICSMFVIFTYVWVIVRANVSKYSIPWSYWMGKSFVNWHSTVNLMYPPVHGGVDGLDVLGLWIRSMTWHSIGKTMTHIRGKT